MNRNNSIIGQLWNNPIQEVPWLEDLKQFWKRQGDGFKIFCAIAAINGLVFICWRIRALNPYMTKYFVSQVGTEPTIRIMPMILSNFSHYTLTHIAMNMIVLYSFCDMSIHLFGRENFLALYLSSGVISSFFSNFYKLALNIRAPSLGASGAILGVVGATCLERPDLRLMIIFLPFLTFSSLTALKSIILLDVCGVILKWSFFDHAAHLGGTLFGIYYCSYLRDFMNEKRYKILENWKKIKKLN